MDSLLLCEIILVFGFICTSFLMFLNIHRRWMFGPLLGFPLGFIGGDIAKFAGWGITGVAMLLVFAIGGIILWRTVKRSKAEADEVMAKLLQRDRELKDAFKRYP